MANVQTVRGRQAQETREYTFTATYNICKTIIYVSQSHGVRIHRDSIERKNLTRQSRVNCNSAVLNVRVLLPPINFENFHVDLA